MMILLKIFHMRRGVEISGNKLQSPCGKESPCGKVCTIFEKNSKYIKENHEGTHV
jgi:hypothetical protein